MLLYILWHTGSFFFSPRLEERLFKNKSRLEIEGFLKVLFWKAPIFLVLEVFVYWMASYAFPNIVGVQLESAGLGQVAVFIANHIMLLIPLLIFLWWIVFYTANSMINIILVRFFVLGVQVDQGKH